MLERGFKPVKVELLRTVEEAPGIKSFYFNYDKNRFHYKASQAVHLHLDPQNYPDTYRSFSIASSPTEDFLLFTMRMRAGSIYKQMMNGLKPGHNLAVLGPVGRFILPEDSSRQVVMLGGGIGITPFRSMIKFATDTKLPHRITLLYANRVPEDIVYRQEWEQLQLQYPNLTTVHTITRPEESGGWNGKVGRIDENLVREYVEDLNSAIFYICGPPSMVRDIVFLLRTMNVDTGRIRVEAFMGYD